MRLGACLPKLKCFLFLSTLPGSLHSILGSFFIHWELLHIDNEGERSENAQHHSLNKVHLIQSPSFHYKQLIPQEQVSAGKLYTKKQAKQVKKLVIYGWELL